MGENAIAPIHGPETHAGGLVVKGLEEQIKEQRERQEALFMETTLVSETGLDTDEVFFLDGQAEMAADLRDTKRREVEEFKEIVANTVFEPETSYIEQLLHAKQQQKAQKKRKRKIQIPGSSTGIKKQKLEEGVQVKKEEDPKESEPEVIGSLAGLFDY